MKQKQTATLPAILAYIPVIGWLYVYALERKNALAMYHLRQSIGLILFLIASMGAWIVVAWVLAWLPYMSALSAALFALVIGAYMYGVIAWVLGLIHAVNKQSIPLPIFGRMAEKLPVR